MTKEHEQAARVWKSVEQVRAITEPFLADYAARSHEIDAAEEELEAAFAELEKSKIGKNERAYHRFVLMSQDQIRLNHVKEFPEHKIALQYTKLAQHSADGRIFMNADQIEELDSVVGGVSYHITAIKALASDFRKTVDTIHETHDLEKIIEDAQSKFKTEPPASVRILIWMFWLVAVFAIAILFKLVFGS